MASEPTRRPASAETSARATSRRSAPESEQGYADLARLLRFVVPYLPVLAACIVFSLLYSAGLAGRAILVAPLMDDVVLPQGQLVDSAANVLALGGEAETEPATTAGSETAAPPPPGAERERLRSAIESRFYDLVLAGLALVLLMPIARLARDYTADWISLRLGVDLQARLGEKVLRLPLHHHQREATGDFMSRLGNDTFLASRAQTVVFGEAIENVTQIVVAVGALLVLNWQLSAVGLVVGPPIAIVLRIFGRRIRRASHARQEQVSEVTQRLVQILTGIKTIKAFHAEGTERQAFSREVTRYFRRSMRVVQNRVLSRSVVELASQLSFVSILMVGIYAVLHELWGLTIGSLVAFITMSAMLYRPAKALPTIYNAIQDAMPAARRVFEVLDAPETPVDPPDAVAVSVLTRDIRYENVHFHYGREAVLEAVDLTIRAGEIVALVGRTGAGKTTLADLLIRLHEPDQGRILIDGRDIRTIRRASLHDLVSIVTQDPYLFDDTILENIRYGCPDAPLERVIEAARAANVHDFIESLPLRYETHVGEFGSQLSGGQRQRITIARAILRDPQILIFDEATSSLDAKAERAVQDAVANLMKGRTVLLIAHRLSTVKSADRIAVVDGRCIAATGTHQELMQTDGLYRELVNLQLTA